MEREIFRIIKMVSEFSHIANSYVRIPFLYVEMILWKEPISLIKGQIFHVTKVDITGDSLACENWHFVQLPVV
jgi:hypothetical protein